MRKDLKFAGGATLARRTLARGTRDRPDLGKGQLARKRHAHGTQPRAERDAPCIVHIGLRGNVNLCPGERAANLGQQAPVLNDEGVDASGRVAPERLDGTGKLALLHDDVGRHIHTGSARMGKGAEVWELILGDASRLASGIESARNAAINGVGTRRNGRQECFTVTCGRQ